ncbi:MAG: hypothetical protein M3O46_20630 [Myxococcota bacterium]|nr:hypothetical protein [Myxococcota bacterium]
MTTSPETEFEQLLRGLQGLTRTELAELVTSRIPKEDALSFVVVATGLSLDALRFVSARTLLRHPAALLRRR